MCLKITVTIVYFIYSGDKTSATLHILNITVQDDQDNGRYQCIGLSATGGSSDSQWFTVRVTPSKLHVEMSLTNR